MGINIRKSSELIEISTKNDSKKLFANNFSLEPISSHNSNYKFSIDLSGNLRGNKELNSYLDIIHLESNIDEITEILINEKSVYNKIFERIKNNDNIILELILKSTYELNGIVIDGDDSNLIIKVK